MELIIACIYCGIGRFASVTDYCYTDSLADRLLLPVSPSDLARKHSWIETKIADNWGEK